MPNCHHQKLFRKLLLHRRNLGLPCSRSRSYIPTEAQSPTARRMPRPVLESTLVQTMNGMSASPPAHAFPQPLQFSHDQSISPHRNLSEALTGPRQTNQRAELTAVLRALELGPDDRRIVIRTDSKYTISCVTEWFRRWEMNGWKNARGVDVENVDLIKLILAKIRGRSARKLKTDFEWVKGHSNDAGNTAADKLAVQGPLLGNLSRK